MSENYFALERLSAQQRIDNAAEAHRDHVGAAVVRMTSDHESRLRRMVAMIDASLVVIQRALKRRTASANGLTPGGKTKSAAH